jgi:ferredoxin
MALNPAGPIAQAECLNCRACVASCPEQILSLLPSLAIRRRMPRTPPASARAAGAALALLALLAWSVPSAAHHMRGQPHYGYTENYPQVPTQEARAVIGDFTVTVVSYFFHGLRRERSDTPDDVQFFINLQNWKTRQSYTDPLRIEVWRDGSRLNRFEHLRPLEEAVYRVRQAVPGPGTYELRLSTGSLEGSIHVHVAGDSRSWTPYAVALLLAAIFTLYVASRRRPLWQKRGMSRVARGA